MKEFNIGGAADGGRYIYTPPRVPLFWDNFISYVISVARKEDINIKEVHDTILSEYRARIFHREGDSADTVGSIDTYVVFETDEDATAFIIRFS